MLVLGDSLDVGVWSFNAATADRGYLSIAFSLPRPMIPRK